MIKTEFSYSEEEIKDFFRFHLTTKDKTKLIYYVSSLLFVLLGCLFMFVYQKVLFGFLLFIIAIVLVLIFPFQINRTLNKQVHSRYKRNKQTITFYEDKIVQNIDGTEVEYLWNNILEVNETKKYLFLYINKSKALIVNKTTLTIKVLEDLISLIKKKMGKIILYKYK